MNNKSNNSISRSISKGENTSFKNRGPLAWSFLDRIGGWCLDQIRELVGAIRFLSSMPLPGTARLFPVDDLQPRLFLGSAYFPLVGLIIASLLSLLVWLLGAYLPPLVLAACLVICGILLTGGLHLDGLMDTCDGLFSGREPERKLEIMRDSRTGSFGVLGGVGVLLLKFALLASLPSYLLPYALLTVLPVSHWGMVLALRFFPAARQTGLGATFRQTVTPPRCLFAALFACCCAVLAGHLLGLLIWLSGSAIVCVLGIWVTRAIGGLTGDVYGFLAEGSEALLLLLFELFRFLR